MNIAFFLKPKSEIIYMTTDASVRQTLEKMEHHSYSAIPVIDVEGHFFGTITEGDLLWHLKKNDFPDLNSLEDSSIKTVKRRVQNKPVSIHAEIEELVTLAINQNFVPVIDDQGIFIGIVIRKNILEFFYEKSKSINLLHPSKS